MSVKADGRSKKLEYMNRLIALMEEYPRVLLATCDNIGSSHMQDIRLSLRGRGVLLMGKNTLMRKALRLKLAEHPEWESLIYAIKGNVGLVFTHEKLQEIQSKLLESRVPAVAKAGIIAPEVVILPKQVTTLEPTKTNFFAALDIATKITRGCVEILNDVKLCEEGKKVGSSEAALLAMLDIKPFTYGLRLTTVYDDGCAFDSKLLKKTPEDLYKALGQGIGNVAALSLALHYPTLPAFPHAVSNAFKNLVAITLETSYSFKQADELKKRVENPTTAAVVVVAPVAPEPVPTVVTTTAAQTEDETTSDEGGDGLADFF